MPTTSWRSRNRGKEGECLLRDIDVDDTALSQMSAYGQDSRHYLVRWSLGW